MLQKPSQIRSLAYASGYHLQFEHSIADHEDDTMRKQVHRRHLLRGAGALIALPALESLGFRRFASAAETKPAKPAKRMLSHGIGIGEPKETWLPDLSQTVADYELSK